MINQKVPEELAEEIRAALLIASKQPPFLTGEEHNVALGEFMQLHPMGFVVAPMLLEAIRDWTLLFTRFITLYTMLGIDLTKLPPPTPFMKKLIDKT